MFQQYNELFSSKVNQAVIKFLLKNKKNNVQVLFWDNFIVVVINSVWYSLHWGYILKVEGGNLDVFVHLGHQLLWKWGHRRCPRCPHWDPLRGKYMTHLMTMITKVIINAPIPYWDPENLSSAPWSFHCPSCAPFPWVPTPGKLLPLHTNIWEYSCIVYQKLALRLAWVWLVYQNLARVSAKFW